MNLEEVKQALNENIKHSYEGLKEEGLINIISGGFIIIAILFIPDFAMKLIMSLFFSMIFLVTTINNIKSIVSIVRNKNELERLINEYEIEKAKDYIYEDYRILDAIEKEKFTKELGETAFFKTSPNIKIINDTECEDVYEDESEKQKVKSINKRKHL